MQDANAHTKLLDVPIYAHEMEDLIKQATNEQRLELILWTQKQQLQLDKLTHKAIMCISEEGRSQFVRSSYA